MQDLYWRRIEVYCISIILKSVFVGPSKIPFANIPDKEKSAWNLPIVTSAYHASSDASLFSSSLPVLPHVKRKHGDYTTHS